MNGASPGGVVIAPLLVLAISRFGFAFGLDPAAVVIRRMHPSTSPPELGYAEFARLAAGGGSHERTRL
jgi:hypothetical protein